MFEKFSKKIGFTQTEVIVILFLALLFIVGYVYVKIIKNNEGPESKYIDYSKEDSLFAFYSIIDPEDSSSMSDLDIKKSVLELSDTIAYTKKDFSTL
ncbi:MAG TPA: hypothetical protein VIY47_09770, partial [Ignavibacteriaceae bacterium]